MEKTSVPERYIGFISNRMSQKEIDKATKYLDRLFHKLKVEEPETHKKCMEELMKVNEKWKNTELL